MRSKRESKNWKPKKKPPKTLGKDLGKKSRHEMTFAEQLQSHRRRLGLTQAEAAAILEVSKRTYEYWEIDRLPLKITQDGALARLEKAREILDEPEGGEELSPEQWAEFIDALGRVAAFHPAKSSKQVINLAHLARSQTNATDCDNSENR